MPPFSRPILVTLTCLAVAGCGMGDYLRHMDAERARVRVFDEENRALDEAAEMPQGLPPRDPKDRKEKEPAAPQPLWPFDVYLRLPAGVAPKAAGRYVATESPPVPLARYPGKDITNVFIAAGFVGEKAKDGTLRPGAWAPDDFRRLARGALREYYKKEYKAAPALFGEEAPAKDSRPRPSWRHEELPPLELERSVGTDAENKAAKEPSQFEMYYHRAGDRQVVVIYQYPEALKGDQRLKQAIDLSLRTLEPGDRAGERRSELGAILTRRGKKA